ncbi:MAG TPA: PAS domain-containing sensor histidine kinase [Tepidisphaeraceae bacterium]|jgi:PAS domain S-box-containing protein|nr:PAS domain-containing sensor histidine kinase [Tepidisphaeraceae bacterium]
MQQGQWILSRLKPNVAATLAVALSLLLTALIIPAPIQLQFHIGFAIPIFLCAWTRSRRFLWALVICVMAVTLGKIVLSGWPETNTNPWYFVENRAISITTLLCCAGVAHFLIGLIEFTENEHQRLSTILATVPVGMAIANVRTGTVVYNKAGAAMLGVEADVPHDLDDLMGRFSEIESAAESHGNGQDIVRAINGEITSSVERMFRFRDGRQLVVLVSAAPLVGRHGKRVGAVSGFVDITEQKRMQAAIDQQRREAEQASQRKSRFLAAVSHDIRTPANAINLMAELLERSTVNPSPDADIAEIARDLKSSALSLVRLVSDVLDLTHFDNTRVELVEDELSLTQLLLEKSRQFSQIARDKGLEFKFNGSGDAIIIRTDRVKLGRVIDNLLGNAIKFTQQGSVMLGASRMEDGGVRIEVSDTGPGIAPEHHEQIFDEYFQLKNPLRGSETGSGLGLAICRRLAQAMGASLTVDSTAGEGARFVVTLPVGCVVKAGAT